MLENWKELEVYKLQTMESQAEGFLKNLKLMSRYCDVAGVFPEVSMSKKRLGLILKNLH